MVVIGGLWLWHLPVRGVGGEDGINLTARVVAALCFMDADTAKALKTFLLNILRTLKRIY
jgi:hypothetical protein